MLRQNRLAVVSHCVLNQNSVVQGWARAEGAFVDITGCITAAGLGIYQLPCPELRNQGMTRPPKTYTEYDTAEYKAVCHGIVKTTIVDMAAFKTGGIEAALLVGIRRSPTCSLAEPMGHLYRLLLPGLRELFPGLMAIDIPEDFTNTRPGVFIEQLKRVLTAGCPD